MKVFHTRLPVILILFFSLIATSILIPSGFAQEDTQIPTWIKNVAGWWANGEISENEFLSGIEYLINNNIISLEYIPCSLKAENLESLSVDLVPTWIKNNAEWWSEDLIGDTDFINGIEYLIKIQVITIDNEKIVDTIPVDDITFSPAWNFNKNNLVYISSSFFKIYGAHGDCIIENGVTTWNSLSIGLDPNKMDMYNKIAVWDDPQKTVVVYPYFTYAAYAEPGFYTYYSGMCDHCTTTNFASPIPLFSSSGHGHQVLSLLGYSSIADVEIDKNPDILYQFDKVIMLHNEYVTRAMFDAITNHPNVVYLYPNALYAEIEVDYTAQTITLIRGHNYPDAEIKNGFDWEFDNTHPYEYITDCSDMEFYQIKNGWMTTCYPENLFLKNTQDLFDMLKIIKNL